MSSRDDKIANAVEVATDDFTERVLLSLVFDLSLLTESVERIKVQVLALAREHGVPPSHT